MKADAVPRRSARKSEKPSPIFTEEPRFTHKATLAFPEDDTGVILPRTDGLPDMFAARYGEDLMTHLAELPRQLPGGQAFPVRHHCHEHISG